MKTGQVSLNMKMKGKNSGTDEERYEDVSIGAYDREKLYLIKTNERQTSHYFHPI